MLVAWAVVSPTPVRPDPVARGRLEGTAGPLYGGLRGETAPEPDRLGTLDVFFGLRPELGRAALDLHYDHSFDADGGGLALEVSRRLGAAAALGAKLQLGAGELRTEARAELVGPAGTAYRGTLAAEDPAGAARLVMDLAAVRPLGERADLRLRQLFASDGAERTELTLRAEF